MPAVRLATPSGTRRTPRCGEQRDLNAVPLTLIVGLWPAPPALESELRRNGEELAVFRPGDVPASAVHQRVMSMTQKDQVVHVGGSLVLRPVYEVMRCAPLGRPIATRPPAALVSGIQSPPHGRRGQPPGPSELDHLRVGVQKDACDGAVAGRLAQSLHADR